jgi:hypothetical protein
MQEVAVLFSQPRITEIYKAAVAVRADREALLGGLPPAFAAELACRGAPGSQILSDLTYMNEVGALGDGGVPLRVWLINAAALFEIRSEARVFVAALRDLEAILGDRAEKAPTRASWLDTPRYPHEDARATALHRLLVAAYCEAPRARALAKRVPISLDHWRCEGGIGPAWDSLLELASAQGKLRALLDAALADPEEVGYHRELRALLDQEPAR